MVVFSDFLTEDLHLLQDALQHLRYQSHEVMLFHVYVRPTELNLDFKDGPYFFYDLEEEGRLKIDPEEIRRDYQEQMKQWEKDLYLRCGMLGVDFFTVDTTEPFHKILFACLMKRLRM